MYVVPMSEGNGEPNNATIRANAGCKAVEFGGVVVLTCWGDWLPSDYDAAIEPWSDLTVEWDYFSVADFDIWIMEASDDDD
jgi:hypothetical protein